jgi:hypothetical protein
MPQVRYVWQHEWVFVNPNVILKSGASPSTRISIWGSSVMSAEGSIELLR